MKNSRFVAGVKVVLASSGNFEYHIPSTMTGAAFIAWQKENGSAIELAKAELSPEQDAEGDTSTGGGASR